MHLGVKTQTTQTNCWDNRHLCVTYTTVTSTQSHLLALYGNRAYEKMEREELRRVSGLGHPAENATCSTLSHCTTYMK